MNKKFFFKDLLKLAWPIMVGQVGIMLIGFGDILVASWHSALSVASIGIAVNALNPIFLLGIGFMMGVSSFISIEIGKKKDLKNSFKSALVFCLIISAFLMLLTYFLIFFVDNIGITQEMIPYIKQYMKIVLFSFPFALIYQLVKEYLQGHEKVKLANSVAIAGAIVNIPLNYCLVFGKFGFAQLGFEGMAYASLIIRILMAFVMILPLVSKLKESKVDTTFIKDLFLFSYPIGFMIFFEVLGFCLFGILAGKFGVIEAATNSLVLNLASLTFMVPLSISSAVGVKVGNAFGNKSYLDISSYSFVAIILSMSFMCFTAFGYFFLPREIMTLVSSDIDIINLGVKILLVVAIFQLVDGLQVTLGGILRGLNKTREPFFGIITGFWFIGIPLGIYLGFSLSMNLVGLWSGLAIALTIVSIILSILTIKELKKIKSFSSL